MSAASQDLLDRFALRHIEVVREAPSWRELVWAMNIASAFVRDCVRETDEDENPRRPVTSAVAHHMLDMLVNASQEAQFRIVRDERSAAAGEG